MPSVHRDWQHPRDLLDRYGLKPRKSFGQNFLVDPNFAEAIAAAASPDGESVVVEIGPGTGVLTRALLRHHPKARVLAVELDRGLAVLLRAEFEEALADHQLTLIECDALENKHELNRAWTVELERISKQEKRPRRILCSNLPYHAATPIIANLTLQTTGPQGGEPLCSRIIATIQAELGQRLLASKGSKSYGPLAAFLALRAEGHRERTAGKSLFWPQPKVTSAVISLSLLEWAQVPFPASVAHNFLTFLQSLFHHRRKTLGSILKDELPKGDKQATMRAEQLEPLQLWDLFKRCRETQS